MDDEMMDETPDVPASSLVRHGELAPVDARLRYIVPIEIDPRGSCQVCGEHERLVVFEIVVDRNNGQRITAALCLLCLRRGVEYFDQPAPKPEPGYWTKSLRPKARKKR